MIMLRSETREHLLCFEPQQREIKHTNVQNSVMFIRQSIKKKKEGEHKMRLKRSGVFDGIVE